MLQPGPQTYHAPAGRESDKIIRYRNAQLRAIPVLPQILDGLPSLAAVLNPCRQIVLANRSMLKMLGVDEEYTLLGLRPGEAVSCVNAGVGPDGCGTSERCQNCEAVLSIMEAMAGQPQERESRIQTVHNGLEHSLDLLISPVLFELDGDAYVFISMEDVANRARRRVLERLFFHDLLNTAGGIKGFADMLHREAPDSYSSLAENICQASDRLMHDIQFQKILLEAENQDLKLAPAQFLSLDLVEQVARIYGRHEAAEGKTITVDPESQQTIMVSDSALLSRVLGNLVKNALEASPPDAVVEMSCREDNGQVEFSVKNPGHIPPDIGARLFHRSFSTKGSGRGLGTYSVKLFTERYLGGRVSFRSSPEEGTVFTVRCPLTLPTV
jgi:signal transduction histidine kinase